MASSYPSVQTFYRPEPVRGMTESYEAVTLSKPGDGFNKVD